ncbi:MAG: hypothetical protein WC600_17025 [Desulfobaccales bacterium]
MIGQQQIEEMIIQPHFTLIDTICIDCLSQDFRSFYSGEDNLCAGCGGRMVPESDFSKGHYARPSRLITGLWLLKQGACSPGLRWFAQNFPHGATFDRVLIRLYQHQKYDWVIWLNNHEANL